MKKALVIGATSGIGKELAVLLSNNGYKIAISGRRENLLNEIKNASKGFIISEVMDLTDINSIPTKIERIISNLEGLDLVVISSGCGELNYDLEFDIEKNTIDLNVTGFTAAINYIYNYFSMQKQGHIVAITSVMGLRGSCAAPAYSATKAYQINYLEAFRQRTFVEKNNITITDIRPGSVNTNMMKGEGHFWIATPQKAAKQILHAIKNRNSTKYITKRWRLIGWILKLLPTWLYNRMGKL
ncbi:MAG: SDR family NAD(P)-dependent oxidoreductase [Rikenellaceae bacterium]